MGDLARIVAFVSAGCKARGHRLSRLATAATRSCRSAASARSFLFCPPSTPTNPRVSPWTLPEPNTPVLVQAPLTKAPTRITSSSRVPVNTSRPSLNTPGACSAMKFSRPPVQLAGSPCPGQARKRLALCPHYSVFPLAVSIFIGHSIDRVVQCYSTQLCDSRAILKDCMIYIILVNTNKKPVYCVSS